MLLQAGQIIIDRLLEKCPSAKGNVFSVGDLAGLEENNQVTPALQVILHSYIPSDEVGGDSVWRELWLVVAVVKNVSRKNRALAMTQEAAVMVKEALAALSGWSFPHGSGVTGSLTLSPPPNPMFTETHAYFPLAFMARPKTLGCEEQY